jgi:large subunit ribosomal protein L28
MANFCYVTGKKCSFGNSVSHANNHTRRKFKSNINKHKIYVGVFNSYLIMKLSTKGLRRIIKNGVIDTLK